jgi:hypothetical protein
MSWPRRQQRVRLNYRRKINFPQIAAYARCLLGSARAQLGRATEGIILISQDIAGLVEVGTRIGIAYYTVRLAEARECAGTIVEALETVEQALQASHPDAHISRLEALWLRGELRLTQEDKNLAGGDFREAIEIARRQSAKSLELRTAVSLAPTTRHQPPR